MASLYIMLGVYAFFFLANSAESIERELPVMLLSMLLFLFHVEMELLFRLCITSFILSAILFVCTVFFYVIRVLPKKNLVCARLLCS